MTNILSFKSRTSSNDTQKDSRYDLLKHIADFEARCPSINKADFAAGAIIGLLTAGHLRLDEKETANQEDFRREISKLAREWTETMETLFDQPKDV